MPAPRKRVGPVGKVVAGVCASVLAIVLSYLTWSAIAVVLEPPAFVYLFGSLVTLGLIAGALYTWAVDGPIVKSRR